MGLIEDIAEYRLTVNQRILNKTEEESITLAEESDCFKDLADLLQRILPDQIISGLDIAIVVGSAVVAPGTWQIAGEVHSIIDAVTLAIDSRDVSLNRYDVLYIDSEGTVGIVSGELSSTPVEPSFPNNTLKLGSILITPTGETVVPPDLSGLVNTATNQDVDGIKTFIKSPVVPVATNAGQAVNLGQLTSFGDGFVHIAGDEEINGIKTFLDNVLFNGSLIRIGIMGGNVAMPKFVNAKFLTADAQGYLQDGGYVPAADSNVLHKTGYADQVFNGNLGATNGYYQTTNSNSGRIGRFLGSVISDIGNVNNINFATGSGMLDVTHLSSGGINMIVGAGRAVNVTGAINATADISTPALISAGGAYISGQIHLYGSGGGSAALSMENNNNPEKGWGFFEQIITYQRDVNSVNNRQLKYNHDLDRLTFGTSSPGVIAYLGEVQALSNSVLLGWAYATAYALINGARDDDGVTLTSPVVWPDGSTGNYTAVPSTEYPGNTDSYQVTYVPAVGATKTITQATLTRNDSGDVVAQSPLTIV